MIKGMEDVGKLNSCEMEINSVLEELIEEYGVEVVTLCLSKITMHMIATYKENEHPLSYYVMANWETFLGNAEEEIEKISNEEIKDYAKMVVEAVKNIDGEDDEAEIG